MKQPGPTREVKVKLKVFQNSSGGEQEAEEKVAISNSHADFRASEKGKVLQPPFVQFGLGKGLVSRDVPSRDAVRKLAAQQERPL